MKIKKQEMLDTLQLLEPGITTKQSLFVFQKNKVLISSDDLIIAHPTTWDLECIVLAEDFLDLLKKITEEEIELTIEDKEVHVSGKRFKSGIHTFEKKELEMPSIKKWKSLPKDFLEGIELTLISVSKNSDYPRLTCLHVQEKEIESCDRYRVSKYIMDESFSDESWLLPEQNIRFLLKYSPTEFAILDNWIYFKTDSGTIFSTRIHKDTKYPDLSSYWKVRGKDIQFPKNMLDILNRMTVFTKLPSEKGETPSITLELNGKDGKLIVTGTGPNGWFEEFAYIRYKGETIKFSVIPNFLMDILPLLDETIIGINNIVFKKGKKFTHVITLASVEKT